MKFLFKSSNGPITILNCGNKHTHNTKEKM